MTLLRNGRVVDVRRGLVKEASVAIEGGKIVSLGDLKNSESHSIDLEGAYLLPGLVNCHVHLGIVFPFNEFDPRESPAVTALRCLRRGMDALQAGVTTVRTVGTAYGADLFLRSMIQKGWVKGPRIVSAGSSISVTGGHGDNLGALLADGPDEFLKKAREELVSGSNHLKIYVTGGISHREETFDEPQMSLGEMKAVVSCGPVQEHLCYCPRRRVWPHFESGRGRGSML